MPDGGSRGAGLDPALAGRLTALLAAVWAGGLTTLGTIATPSLFALLPREDAGRVAARIFALEAPTSLAFGLVLLVLQRLIARAAEDSPVLPQAGAGPQRSRQFTVDFGLLLLTVFCTAVGYYVIVPLMEPARAGQGPLAFLTLHRLSVACFVTKLAAVLAVAWRALHGLRN